MQRRWVDALARKTDEARRGDKKVIAFSDCRCRCPDIATLEGVEQITLSGDKLRSRLWNWDYTHVTFDNPQDPRAGGSTVHLGVADTTRSSSPSAADSASGVCTARSLVTDAGLRPLWSRHYKSAKSAFGPTTTKKLASLLELHPAPGGEIRVLTEARRLNHREGVCRWCQARISPGLGHLVGHGDAITVERFGQCPTRAAQNGARCVLCGITVTASRPGAPASEVLVREGTGRWVTRHLASVRCTSTPPESHEDYLARRAAARAAEDAARAAGRRKQAEADERRARRAAQRRVDAHAAQAAEAARVAGLHETGRTTVNLHDKGLGGSLRAAMDEITVALSDGTTTTRWSVRTYHRTATGWTGEDYDPDEGHDAEYTTKADAQYAYRALKFQPDRPARVTSGGRAGDQCGRGGARIARNDSSGIAGIVCAGCDRCADVELSFA
ncbi:hypothetical protein J2S43_001125 [Catenuloplanes nepalensis]|uniref:Uncharacterized protein n=1 Tax=Catenuloplanes nepalensis TaxID=587533 RepID=A0ABT9MMI4_9ACTN|nr:hypothetical protein [Catenuloplanes nepalensis]MDP9792613.1 hypothetical protein [Catenuloplanes nepalensis]